MSRSNNTLIVKLHIPGDKLKEFDFTDKVVKKPRKRPTKAKPEAKDDNSNLNSGIITNGGADPISGTLPRTVKAAPVANTQGLVLDKTPCRKWHRTPFTLKTFTNYSINVLAWTSTYKPGEYEAKLARESKESKEKVKSETPEAPERRKLKLTLSRKPEDKEQTNADGPRELESQKNELNSETWDMNSEPMSEPQGSEPPSEAFSEDNIESRSQSVAASSA